MDDVIHDFVLVVSLEFISCDGTVIALRKSTRKRALDKRVRAMRKAVTHEG